MAKKQAEHAEKSVIYEELGTNAQDALPVWKQEYERQTEDKSFSQFRDNYLRRRKANQTLVDKAVDSMKESMGEYKTAHDFGAPATMEGYTDFETEYLKLKNSELLQYEGKVDAARQAAEEEFREQFLSKLQENMKMAQAELKELNKALNDIVFSNEKYEFLYMPSKRYRQYYEMIMDDFNAMQETEKFIQACVLVERNRKPCYIREFSIMHFQDSKYFENIEKRIAKVFRQFSGEYAEMDTMELLAEYGIYRTPNYVYFKGAAGISIGEETVDLSLLKQGIGISGEDLSSICFSDLSRIKKVITIENLTSFFRYWEEDSFFIYLGGYHNRIRRALLTMVYETIPDASIIILEISMREDLPFCWICGKRLVFHL